MPEREDSIIIDVKQVFSLKIIYYIYVSQLNVHFSFSFSFLNNAPQRLFNMNYTLNI